RRGAMRVAVYCAAAEMLSWLFGSHHVPSPTAESQIFFHGIATALFEGGMVWITYIAIEPVVRRRWPDLLISWSRMLSGRWRDPLVGRDVLAGLLGGAAMVLVFSASNSLANWLEIPGMTPAPPMPRYLLGVPALVGHFVETCKDGAVRGLAIMTVLVLAVVVLRRRWVAAAFATLLLMSLALSGENYAVEVPAGLLIAGISITVAA